MILDKEVEIKWHGRNKNHFIEKGYMFTKVGDTFTVKISDLTHGSTIKVNVQCVSCKAVYSRAYSQVVKSLNETILKEYYCTRCISDRIKTEHNFLQSKGLLTRGDNGYWTFRENVEKELMNFFKKHGDVRNIKQRDNKLHQGITMDGRPLKQIVESVGLNWEEVYPFNLFEFYKDFDNVKERIEEFINEHGRFPTIIEVYKTLNIHSTIVGWHGGLTEIKKKMNYIGDGELVDDSGFKNKSSMEFKVAQYLIANNIPYKRDVKPFKDRRFLCDFMIVSEDGIKYYVEVWGFPKSRSNGISKTYNSTRIEKEKKYYANDLNLISIEFDEFYHLNYKETQEYLKRKFSFLSKQPLKIFKTTNFMHPTKLTDKDILDTIMKFSDDENYLPPQKLLHKHKMNRYMVEIRKRYGSYYNFACKYNKRVLHLKNVYKI